MNYKRVREYSGQCFNEEYQPFNKKSKICNEEFLNFSNPPDYIFNQMKIPRRTNNEISSNANEPLISDTVSPILPPFPQVADNFRKICGSVTKNAIEDDPELTIAGKPGKPNTTTAKQLKYYRCEQCGIFLSSQTTLDAHLAGVRHAKKLKELELSNINTNNLKKDKVSKLSENEFLCKVCKVSAKSLVQIKSHIDGSRHMKNIKTYREKKHNKSNTIKELPKPNDETTTNKKKSLPVAEPTAKPCNNDNKPTTVSSEPKQSFFCEVCGLCMNSQVQFDQHVNSKKHSAKVSKLHVTEN